MTSYGYVGYCHLGKPRVWASTEEDCKTQAEIFRSNNPRYMTRKGINIVELVIGKKVNKVVYKM
tara:strand:- start:150 stop:341 length:192 start_codon:yes stop_codon:yes gene_type:complete